MLPVSVTSALLERGGAAVEVIAGERLSALGRYGAPAGIGTAITLLELALE